MPKNSDDKNIYSAEEIFELIDSAPTYTVRNGRPAVDKTNSMDTFRESYATNLAVALCEEMGCKLTINLENGDKVLVYEDENSIHHDGAEIGIIIEVNDQLFRQSGNFSSHDSPFWDESYMEVEKEVRLVPTTFYHRKDRNKK